MSTEKKPLAFGFSKIKAKTTLVQTEAVKTFSQDDKTTKTSEFELITSIEGKKITPINGSASAAAAEKKQPLVIPCTGNKLVFDLEAKSKEKQAQAAAAAKQSSDTPMDTQPNMSQEDLEAIKLLLADTEKRKHVDKNENALVIKADENHNRGAEKEEIVAEEPDYEKIEIEKFGLAALRGMGWSEKDGIGLTNKRKTTFVEPELRPKGLGLGAGSSSSKKQRTAEEEAELNLRYVKGACVRIEGGGKHDGECGLIMGFDDGLNRVLIKLASTGENVSVIQFSTKLLTKDEYRRQTEKKSSSSTSSSSSSHRHSSSSSSHYSSSSSHRPSSSSSHSRR